MNEIQLLNTKLVREIQEFDEDELWQLFYEKMDTVQKLRRKWEGSTFLYICLSNEFWLFRQRFLEEVETNRETLNYNLALDFCFEGERLKLGYYAVSGLYDDPNSCDVLKSDELMPYIDDESD